MSIWTQCMRCPADDMRTEMTELKAENARLQAKVKAADALASAMEKARKIDWEASTDAEVDAAYSEAFVAIFKYREAGNE